MKFTRLALVFIVMLFCLNQNVSAQTDTTGAVDDDLTLARPNPDPDFKLGIKMGITLSTIVGNENPNSTFIFGLNGGGYIRKKISGKSWVQTEFFIAYRGSRYKAVAQEYDRIKLLYADVPLMYMRSLKNNANRWFAGIQGSILITPSMYLSGQPVPVTSQLNLKRFDLLPLIGYLYQMDFFAIQSSLKYGLINLNTGQIWPQNARPFNKNGSMHNVSFEISFLF